MTTIPFALLTLLALGTSWAGPFQRCDRETRCDPGLRCDTTGQCVPKKPMPGVDDPRQARPVWPEGDALAACGGDLVVRRAGLLYFAHRLDKAPPAGPGQLLPGAQMLQACLEATGYAPLVAGASAVEPVLGYRAARVLRRGDVDVALFQTRPTWRLRGRYVVFARRVRLDDAPRPPPALPATWTAKTVPIASLLDGGHTCTFTYSLSGGEPPIWTVRDRFGADGRYVRTNTRWPGGPVAESRYKRNGSSLVFAEENNQQADEGVFDPCHHARGLRVGDKVAIACRDRIWGCGTGLSSPPIVVLDGGAGREATELVGRVLASRSHATIVYGGKSHTPRSATEVLVPDLLYARREGFLPLERDHGLWPLVRDLEFSGLSMREWPGSPSAITVVVGGTVKPRESRPAGGEVRDAGPGVPEP